MTTHDATARSLDDDFAPYPDDFEDFEPQTTRLVPVPDLDEDEFEPHWDPSDYLSCFPDFCDEDGPTWKLSDSKVAPLVVAARGYDAILNADEYAEKAKGLGLPEKGSTSGWGYARLADDDGILTMPWFTGADIANAERSNSEPTATSVQIRPTKPRKNPTNGKSLKYEFVKGSKTPIGVHPAYSMDWVEKAPTVLIAEGLLKGDSALTGWLMARGASDDDLQWTVSVAAEARERLRALMKRLAPNPQDRLVVLALGGVGTWHSNSEWNAYDLRNRTVWIGVDGDVATNPNVWKQANDLFKFLKSNKKAKGVELLTPTVVGGDKVGIDDFLAKHGTWDDLIQMKTARLPEMPGKPALASIVAPSRGGIFGDVPNPSVCAESARLKLTRMGLAERVVAHYGNQLAYRPSVGVFMVYKDGVWQPNDLLIETIARRVIRSVSVHEAHHAEQASEEVQRLSAQVAAMEAANVPVDSNVQANLSKAKQAARREHEAYGEKAENNGWASEVLKDLRGLLATEESVWDAAKTTFMINFPNGTVDIRQRDATGWPILKPHSPDDRITMQCSVEYDPSAMSEDLKKVKEHIDMSGTGTFKAITRYLGYALTSAMEAKTFLNIWSLKADAAKSTLTGSLFKAVGGESDTSYVGVLDAGDLGVAKAEQSKPLPALDAMRGKRWIVISEAQHVHLGSDLVKRWTGGDAIRTRTLYGKGGVWQPAGKLLMIGQGPTPFSVGDKAMVSRFFGIELQSLTADQVDKNLRHRLESEEGQKAVLAYVVKAACAWYDTYRETGDAREALAIPEHAEKMKKDAVEEMNPLTEWVGSTLVVGDERRLNETLGNIGRVTTKHLCDLYNNQLGRGDKPYSARTFGPLLTAAIEGIGIIETEFTHSTQAWGTRTVKGKIRTGVRVADKSRWESVI